MEFIKKGLDETDSIGQPYLFFTQNQTLRKSVIGFAHWITQNVLSEGRELRMS